VARPFVVGFRRRNPRRFGRCRTHHSGLNLGWIRVAGVTRTIVANMADSSQTLLTVADVAERLQVSRDTVYREIKEGRMPCYKVRGEYRLTPQQMDAYLDAILVLRKMDDSLFQRTVTDDKEVKSD